MSSVNLSPRSAVSFSCSRGRDISVSHTYMCAYTTYAYTWNSNNNHHSSKNKNNDDDNNDNSKFMNNYEYVSIYIYVCVYEYVCMYVFYMCMCAIIAFYTYTHAHPSVRASIRKPNLPAPTLLTLLSRCVLAAKEAAYQTSWPPGQHLDGFFGPPSCHQPKWCLSFLGMILIRGFVGIIWVKVNEFKWQGTWPLLTPKGWTWVCPKI